ncbi:MAG: hypothetical protein IPJ17_06610 [Holophagales bacterium]|nr:MAG: hypothetical protein IPJ17_06610 [Holophagales bacterium]
MSVRMLAKSPDGEWSPIQYDAFYRFEIQLSPGYQVILRYSTNAAAEQACLVHYDNGALQGEIKYLELHLESGTPPYRDLNNRRITQSGVYFVVGWSKMLTPQLEGPANQKWHQSRVKGDLEVPLGYIHKIGFDDRRANIEWVNPWLANDPREEGNDWDFDDTVVLITSPQPI